LKYFTRDYWLSLQKRGYTPPPPGRDPFQLYRAELETLRHRVDREAFEFFAEADVHDGELLDLTVKDGNRPAPLGEPAREWTSQPGFPIRVVLRVIDAADRLVWTLRYSEVRNLKINYSAEADLFPSGSGGGFGFGDWGYHELRDAQSGFLAHEVLFATGATLLIEFRGVAVTSEAARARAEQGIAPDERRGEN
jgi:hypothetical protein